MSEKGVTATAGPNSSSHETRISGLTSGRRPSERTWRRRRSPPATVRAPPASASRIHSSTRSASCSRIIGPIRTLSSSGSSGAYRLYARGERVEVVGVELPAGDDPLRGDADLARVGVAAGDRRADHLVGCRRLGHDDERRVRAELHRDPLESRRPADVLADVPATGEADLPHARVGDDRVADQPSRSRYALDGLWRGARLQQYLRQL